MPPVRTRLVILAAAFSASACAGVETGHGAEARSTCHTSSGEWAGTGRDCAISYSVSKTVSTTTTTTTVETTPDPSSVGAAEDES